MKLRLMNDPILRQKTRLVTQADLPFIKEQLFDMFKVMKDEEGIALAANQVGIELSFFIISTNNGPITVINPEILEQDEPKPFEEGCLSIPGTSGKTMRSQNLKLKFKDIDFNDHEMVFSATEAVAVQHEIDHLNGKLYIDQIAPMKRALVVKNHLEYMKKGRRK